MPTTTGPRSRREPTWQATAGFVRGGGIHRKAPGPARLAELMARLCGPDAGLAAAALAFEFHTPIAAAVRRHLRALGRHRIDDEDLDVLVLDVALDLIDCAPAWRADGGAVPWVWADHRVRAVVSRFVGQHADELDPEHDLERVPVCAWAGDHDDLLAALHSSEHPAVRLVRDALAIVGSERDQAILLEYRAQQQAGDPSPAHTVGDAHALAPPAVRQAVRRLRQRLRTLAETDERFRALADLALIDPAA